MIRVIYQFSSFIKKDGSSFVKRDAVLFCIGSRLLGIPLETQGTHNYSVITPKAAGKSTLPTVQTDSFFL